MRHATSVILLGATLLLAGCGQDRANEAGETGFLDSLIAENRAMQQTVKSLEQFAAPGHLARQSELDQLVTQGLQDPIAEIVASLQSHPELIPFDAVLGGTMHFNPDAIHLLGANWVYAEFEDGHIGGHGVFSYVVQPDTSLSWSVVAASLL